MKLNIDCVRDIMLFVESRPVEPHLKLTELSEALPQYSYDDVYYCCLKLNEGNLLDVVTVNMMGTYNLGIKSIHHLTFEGHNFLENIREKETWDKVKDISAKAGTLSLQFIGEIAKELLIGKLSNFL